MHPLGGRQGVLREPTIWICSAPDPPYLATCVGVHESLLYVVLGDCANRNLFAWLVRSFRVRHASHDPLISAIVSAEFVALAAWASVVYGDPSPLGRDLPPVKSPSAAKNSSSVEMRSLLLVGECSAESDVV